MSFTGNEDHSITLATAAEWTANYREAHKTWLKGHFFGKKAINDILVQANCVGIRIYYALDPDGVQRLVIVGVKANEDDLVNGSLAERGIPCPPFCGSGNVLNGL